MTFDTRRGSLREALFAAGLLFAAGALAACGDDSGKTPPPAVDAGGTGSNPGSGFKDPAAAFATKTPIKHVVVIFGENISFDHYFGTYPHASNTDGAPFTAAPNTPAANNLITPLDVNNGFTALANVDLMANNPNKTNATNATGASNPFRLAQSQASTSDQNHEYTAEQNAYNAGAMDLFPKFTGTAPFASETGVPTSTAMVMGYFDGNTVAALWGYAQKFALNDNSWTTQFGPSTPGMLNLISGQTNGVTAPNNDFTAPSLANNTVPDGQGGRTLVGDIDPIGDKCSSTNQIQMTGKNVGDLLNAKSITWGAFMGGFDLTITNENGTTGCTRITNPSTPTYAFNSKDYIPHHAWFQYYQSTANLTHARPSSIAAIGSSVEADGKTAEPANHNYDAHDLFEAISANNLPAVTFVKAPAWQDAHGGYSNPVDEQNFVASVVNSIQGSPFWPSTAIILAYDDSDGWYDHQAPPIVNPSSLAAIGSPTGVTDIRDTLNGAEGCTHTSAQQGKAVKTTALNGVDGTKPVLGRCGYGTRVPLLVVSPFARTNYIDHTLTDQSSVLKFIEDNWLGGTRISTSSFDNIAGPIDNMFSFPAGATAAENAAFAESRKLILDPATGHEVVQ
jgi:phospholipase C